MSWQPAAVEAHCMALLGEAEWNSHTENTKQHYRAAAEKQLRAALPLIELTDEMLIAGYINPASGERVTLERAKWRAMLTTGAKEKSP
jgi:hypothetical protein